MQYGLRKILKLILFGTFLFSIGISIHAENPELIKKGDDYFNQKKFNDALVIYEMLIDDPILNPLILLKIAFIKEGMGDYAQSLYYLDRYNALQPDQKILKKMEELADKHRLKGYAITDENVFWNFYDKYFLYFVFSLCSIGFFFILSLTRKILIDDFISIQRNSGVVIILLIYLFLINIRPVNKFLIIKNNRSYLMSAASAGSKVLQVVDRGHRLSFDGKSDIWVQTEWEGKKAFVNQKNIWEIEN